MLLESIKLQAIPMAQFIVSCTSGTIHGTPHKNRKSKQHEIDGLRLRNPALKTIAL